MNEVRNTTERYDELMVILAEEMDGVHTRQYETAVKNATQQRDDRLHQTQSNQQTLSDEITANMRVVDGAWQESIEHRRTLVGGDDVNLPTISKPNKPLSDLFSSFRQNYTAHKTLTVHLEQALKEEKRKAEEQRRLAEERLRLEVARQRKRRTITIIAMGMVISVIFAILGINYYTNLAETRRIQQATATQQQQQIVNATATQQIANVNATVTALVAPAMIPLVSNRDWMPVELDFGGVTMVLVPVGCFQMGSNNGGDEQPVHEQCVTEPFWLDKYEVTNALYGSVSGCWYSTEADQPRNCVSWLDAQAFCEARGGTLPSEMQWEYAARGVESWEYPWGNDYDAERVIGEDDPTYGDNRTAPVGSRPDGASWVGAMDMSGNVWEWTSTAYLDYPYTQEDEQPNNSNISRVLRGGSFVDSAGDLRSANRGYVYPAGDDDSAGFRCAFSLNSPGL